MKQLMAAILITASAYAAACTTQTFIVNGKVTTCTTCGTVTTCF